MKQSLLLAICWMAPIWLFAQSWFTTHQNADLMFSGVDFNNTGGALLFNHPNGLTSDGTKLVLCDRFNNRVLVWNIAPTAWNTPPDLVLGQPNFINNNPGTTKSGMNWPGNASLAANGTLAVTDTDNDRILLWFTFPTSSGQSADIAIHLPTITPPGSPMLWGWPWGVWTDGTRLAAVATTGRTLLFWDTLPTMDNETPDYTINLPHFGTPRNISTDGATFFFVGDHNAQVNGNPGTFFWNSYPTAANQPYDFYRDEWIKGVELTSGKLIAAGLRSIYTWNAVPTNAGQNPDFTATPLYYKNGDGVDVVEAGGRIYVNNYNGNDILVYPNPPTEASPHPQFALGVSNYLNNTLDSIGYVQNPAFSTDGQRLFVTSDYDRRIYVYHNFPAVSGVLPDEIISTQSLNIAPWDNTWYNGQFVIVGNSRVCVWNNTQDLTQQPSQQFNGNIGTATFSDLKGVALDSQFFYVADRNGKIYIWEGLPANSAQNPLHTLTFNNAQLSRLSSDGEYFCVAQQSPPAIFVYKVADIANGNTTPWKTVNNFSQLNLPAEALAFNGSLAIANQGHHNVLLWQDINDAGNTQEAVVLGQPDINTHRAAIGQNSLFMPGALLAVDNKLWVGEFKFSSRILQYSYPLVTGTSEYADSDYWRVYPNPVNSELTIEFAAQPEGDVLLFDYLGRLLKKTPTHSPSLRLDLSNYAAGVYVVAVDGKVNQIIKY